MPTTTTPKLPDSPLQKANFFSIISFWWLNDLFKKGYNGPLELTDTYKVFPQDQSSLLGDEFVKQWQTGTKRQTLFGTLWSIFGCRFLLVGLIKFFEECASKIATPLCLGYLIRFFTGTVDETGGYLACGGIILGLVLNIATMHAYFFEIERIGMQIRLACATALYRKALKLSLPSLSGGTAGQMMNLMANDVNRFDNLQHIHYLWIGVVQTGISTVILWKSFGPACLCGLAVLILFVPFQGFLGGVFTALRFKVAGVTDKRIRIMNEILDGIRAIKMHCWEYTFANLVEAVRKEEMSAITKISFLRSINWSLYYTSSKITIFLTLIVYAFNGNHLTAESVFVAVSLYNNIRITMSLHFPLGIAQLADFFVASKRIQEFLLVDERPASPNSGSAETPRICLSNVCAAWTNNGQDALYNSTFQVASNQLVAVVGPVGCGKSTLLHILLRELKPTKGSLELSGKVSYFSQNPWIFCGTVRENILFCNEYNEERYNRVVECCALRRDFSLFGPARDQTVIGDRGVNLSGGQKARISLARAVYAEADIYLMDDPLSAVDAEVARHIFEKCLKNFLNSKIVILVTHQLQFLRTVDKIVAMDGGRIVAAGTLHELLNAGIHFEDLATLADDSNDKDSDREKMAISLDDEIVSTVGDVALTLHQHADSIADIPNLSASEEETLEEDMSVGSVKLRAYTRYFGSGSNCCSVLMLIVFNILTQSLHTGSDYWLQIWASFQEKTRNTTQHGEGRYFYYETDPPKQVQDDDGKILGFDLNDPHNQIMLYSSIISFLFLFSMIRTVTFFQVCISASVKIHKKMLTAVLRAPLRFFYLNPTGRILNRFTKDTDVMDDALPQTFFETMEIFLNVFGIIVLVCIVSPYVLIPTFFLTFAFYFVRRLYIKTARSIKRLEALARSPVYSHISSTLNGMTTIRAFKVEEYFRQKFCETQDMHTATWFLTVAMTRWIGLWLDVIAVTFIASVVVTLILTASKISGAAAGMAVSSAMFLTGVFQWGVRQSTTVESQMVSIERIMDYTHLEPEASLRSSPGKQPPDGWPFKGQLSLKNTNLSYGNQSPTLRNVNLSIYPNEKIGIVGRTGAGKSSLITALFRLAEPSGLLEIDGVNIKDVGLHDLRSKISIIPQDPFLFRASLRKNLNTANKYTDDDIWDALKVVGLAGAVEASPEGLDLEIQEGGSNFSVGQRQLLCLARAILQRNKILILDEATASVDLETDQLVQRTIRDKFEDCTVLTIAHRLFTVMDSDRILVMDEGFVKEFDSPHLLLQNRGGLLSSLVDQSGNESSVRLRNVALEAYQRKSTSSC